MSAAEDRIEKGKKSAKILIIVVIALIIFAVAAVGYAHVSEDPLTPPQQEQVTR